MLPQGCVDPLIPAMSTSTLTASWPGSDHGQISLIHSPTPLKCSTRALMALINNLGIVYHQYCSSSKTPPSPMDISKINTQNAHGLWCRARDCDGNIIPNCQCDTTKLEHLIHKMRVDDIDAWLVQETWLEDDDFDTSIEGYHLFRHNSPIGATGCDHLFRGVAIILSPRYFLAWKAARSPTPITTHSTGEFAGRFIGLNLKFDCLNSSGKTRDTPTINGVAVNWP